MIKDGKIFIEQVAGGCSRMKLNKSQFSSGKNLVILKKRDHKDEEELLQWETRL